MASTKSKRKTKPKKVVMKFSEREFSFLKKCAGLENATLNKFLKDIIKANTQSLKSKIKDMEKEAKLKKQLNLFDSIRDQEEEAKQSQTSMIEEYKEFYS